jgi:hypothetical protein
MSMIETAGYTRSEAEPARYPVNLRVTVPFPRPFFVTLIVGAEKRSPERLRKERALHPVNTWGNLAVTVAAWTMLTLAALFTALVATAL